MGANTYAIVERLNLGSHQGVVVNVTFNTPATGGESFLPGDAGLSSIVALLSEPTYVASGAHEYGVSYDRTNNKLTSTDAGSESALNAVTLRVLAIGK